MSYIYIYLYIYYIYDIYIIYIYLYIYIYIWYICNIYICIYIYICNRYAGHCWRSRDELISDVLLWTPTYGWAKAGRPAQTYIQQLCEDTGCSPEDLPEAMNDREKWRERVSDICASSTTWWWWWWWYVYIYNIYIYNIIYTYIIYIYIYIHNYIDIYYIYI